MNTMIQYNEYQRFTWLTITIAFLLYKGTAIYIVQSEYENLD